MGTGSLPSCKLSQGDARYDPPLHQRSTNDRPGCFFSCGLIRRFFFLPKKATKSNLNLQAPDFVRILDVHAFKTLRVCWMLDFLFLSPLQTSNRIFFDIQKSTSPHEKSKRDKDQLPLTCKALRLKSKSSVSCGCAKVLPANQDMSVSDSLQLARQVDPQGLRHLVMVVGYCFGRDVFDLDLCRLVATTVGIFFGCGCSYKGSLNWVEI